LPFPIDKASGLNVFNQTRLRVSTVQTLQISCCMIRLKLMDIDYRGNQFHHRGNPATGHSLPAVLPQVSPAKPRYSRCYRGITSVPITVQDSTCHWLLGLVVAVADGNNSQRYSDKSPSSPLSPLCIMHITPAHSDCCFLRRVQIFLLTYLLTI